jgi:ATP-dependent Clp protease protease subunit
LKIKIRGVIVPNDDKWIYDWFDMEATSPKDVETQLEASAGEDIEVEINSVGGDVYAGSEIYAMLKDYAGNVTIKIVGLAASAASVIAMSGNRVLIAPTAQMMIHNVWSIAWGDYRAMEHEADVLKGWNKSIANAYMLKSGMSQGELLALMDKESWLTAQDAFKYKLVDEIMFDAEMKLVASVKGQILPPEVINKVKNLLKRLEAQESVEHGPQGGILNKVLSQLSAPESENKPKDEPENQTPEGAGEEVTAGAGHSDNPPASRRLAPVDIYQKLILNNKEGL